MLTQLAESMGVSLGLIATTSATNAAIQEKNVGSEDPRV